MSAQRHRIRRQIFEIAVDDPSAAWRVQNELGRIQSQRLAALLDRCLSELAAPDRLHRIDSLEVDLGFLNPDNLEQDLAEKLEPALRTALMRRIERDLHDDAQSGEDAAVSARIELVAYFVRTGNLPWWADTSRPRPIDDAVALLLRRARPALTALVRMLVRERGLLRLLLHCSDTRAAELAGLLLPSAHAELQSFLTVQAALLRELLPGNAALPISASAWRQALALGLVQAASSPTAGSEGPEVLVQDVLAHAAVAAGLSLRVLVAGLQAQLQARPDEPRSAPREALAAIVQRLAAQLPHRLAAPPVSAQGPEARAAEAGADHTTEEAERERAAGPDAPPLRPDAAAEATAREGERAAGSVRDERAPALGARRAEPQDGATSTQSRRESDAPRQATPDVTRDAQGGGSSSGAHGARGDAAGAARSDEPQEAHAGIRRSADRPAGPGARRDPPGDAGADAERDAASDALAFAASHAARDASGEAASSARAQQSAEGEQRRAEAARGDAVGAASAHGQPAAARPAPSRPAAPTVAERPRPDTSEVDALLARLMSIAGPLQPLLAELQAAVARAPEIKAALLQPLQLLAAYSERGGEQAPGPAPELVLQRLLGPLRRRGLVPPQAVRAGEPAQSTEPTGEPPNPPSPAQSTELAAEERLPPLSSPQSAAQKDAAESARTPSPQPAVPTTGAARPQDAPAPPPAQPASLRHGPGRAIAAKEPAWAARPPRPVPLGFSESDALYVDNAGLVVLWPFLGPFFSRLGLQEEGKWTDRAALHRAVGLLQHVATGDREPQEHQLALAKGLCGLPADEVFVFGEPVTEAEAEEAAGLIGAALVNAPAFAELSVDELRSTFLNRPGALSVRSGSWLLRVERAEQDAALEQLPWGLGWVMLPWLEQPLCVEW